MFYRGVFRSWIVPTPACLLLFALGAGTVRATADEPISTATLLHEMIDTVRLGDFPKPAYTTVQFSSHDRRSSLPGGPGWFANSDGFGREPNPNFEAVLDEPNAQGVGRYLIADVRGPGAIVRTWSAAIEGTIRVFLDGSAQPIYDGPAAEFLQDGLLRFVRTAGISEDTYVGTFRQRDACYFPIPFAQRCRIEWIGNVQRIHFYEVQVRCYVPGTPVTTLSARSLKELGPAILRSARVLADPQHEWSYHSKHAAVPLGATVPPGESKDIIVLEGPSAVERLTLKVRASDLPKALRQTILHITFDDHTSAQVQCPVGDFFGAAPGVNPFNSVPFTVEPNGSMTCRYVMPFAKSCAIRLENRGAQPVHVSGDLLPVDWVWDKARSMHFRARWRVDHDLVAQGGDRAQDLPFLLAQGTGVYVGTAIMLLNPNPVPTPYGNWWGEGDEKVMVDDDIVPSTFGTGSEDYFNYSWSSPDIFLYAYCGQPRNDGPANRGFVVNHRWHILDALPFRQRIAFFMELFSHERTEHFSYARIGYHYGRPGIVDDFVRLTDEDVRPLELPADWQPAARGAARNSVFFQAEDLLKDRSNTSLAADNLWAGGKLLNWSPEEADTSLVLTIPVPKKGRYAIHITAAQTPRANPVAALLDGKALKLNTPTGTMNLKTDFRTQLRNYSSPTLELDAGDHALALQLASPKAAVQPTKTTIGIDFVWLQRR